MNSWPIFGDAEIVAGPVVSDDFFVMNHREEIFRAVEDYQAGRFGGLT